MTKLQTLIIVLLVAALSACSGGGGSSGSSKSVTGTTASYSNNGMLKTVITTYNDGTGTSTTPTGTLTTPSYSADGSQKTLVYSFSDGTTHNGATLSGTLATPSYSADGSQKTLVYSFSDGTTHNGPTLTGTPNTVYANDHVTATITYSFSDNTQKTVTKVVEPTLTTQPLLTQAVYPADWAIGTSTATVQKPSVSTAFGTYGDGTSYSATGSTVAPYRQATLTPNGPNGAGAINDPNANVLSPSAIRYNLTWGTPDAAGPGYANNFSQGTASYTLPASMKIFDAVLSSSTPSCLNAAANVAGCGAILPTPSSDVIDAWNKGWTGKGQNVVIIDDIGDSPISPHPATVETIAHRYAWGATFYGMSYLTTTPTVQNLDGSAATTANSIPINVINMSFGADLATAIGRSNSSINPWTTSELLTQRAAYQVDYTNAAVFLTQTAYMGPGNTGIGGFNFSDAVLVKAAANDNIDAQYEPLVYWLSRNQADVLRLLIVGALTDIGTTATPVTIAAYSNTAGTDNVIQSRFLTESGKAPFAANTNAYNGAVLESASNNGNYGNVGTSYAAPRVAGYAAIVRQKFPNLTGANTADILLATARYDTLSCYPNCDKAIYGQGEASLSRALAPVGYLR